MKIIIVSHINILNKHITHLFFPGSEYSLPAEQTVAVSSFLVTDVLSVYSEASVRLLI